MEIKKVLKHAEKKVEVSESIILNINTLQRY